ncbi:hypothetical protein BRADO4300 [Bradyrhizobium sp. ORS 278]|uniref:hypothetical protein n=1 Tax=Bradyrhizobium sp. (strain ORS 278) TaxID=114615 RepID=UPI0001508F70|nr:hypothetical protein [Bradyrhizobium sp. ORS 278]CAL78048.1 hypothetical protein BRADO4300 [Bradyrhizobium sp. ORS 278]
MARKFTPREVIARSYPSWDFAMSDRLIAWLDHCGYEIVKKRQELAAKAVTRELHAEVVDA